MLITIDYVKKPNENTRMQDVNMHIRLMQILMPV